MPPDDAGDPPPLVGLPRDDDGAREGAASSSAEPLCAGVPSSSQRATTARGHTLLNAWSRSPGWMRALTARSSRRHAHAMRGLPAFSRPSRVARNGGEDRCSLPGPVSASVKANASVSWAVDSASATSSWRTPPEAPAPAPASPARASATAAVRSWCSRKEKASERRRRVYLSAGGAAAALGPSSSGAASAPTPRGSGARTSAGDMGGMKAGALAGPAIAATSSVGRRGGGGAAPAGAAAAVSGTKGRTGAVASRADRLKMTRSAAQPMRRITLTGRSGTGVRCSSRRTLAAAALAAAAAGGGSSDGCPPPTTSAVPAAAA